MAIETNANTAAQLKAQAADFLPVMWEQGARTSEANADFFQQFEGTGPRSFFHTKTDFSKGGGQKMNFRTDTGLYEDGVRGDELINNDGEEWQVGNFSLTVDFVRHSTKWNLRTEEQTGLKYEIKEGKNKQLASWMGRKKTKDMMMMLNHLGGGENYVFANNKGSRELLKSTDTISMDFIVGLGQQLKTLGGLPARVGRDREGNDIDGFALVATGEGLVSLKRSSDYKQANREAGKDGPQNVIFKGGYVNIDGHYIKEYNPIDHDGAGPIGSPMGAKAKLGIEIPADNVAYVITGGGTTAKANNLKSKYFEDFSNYAYRFGTDAGQTLVASGSTRYCLIVNTTGADAGKMGFYSYVVNDGNRLTMVNRLRAAASGAAVSTIGGVTWNTGVWANLHTDTHPAGSVIVETNSFGVPIGRSYMLGAMAACRGYGSYRNRRHFDPTGDGQFIKKLYIMSVFGQSPYRRVDNVAPNFKVLEHAVEYQGLPIPVVS